MRTVDQLIWDIVYDLIDSRIVDKVDRDKYKEQIADIEDDVVALAASIEDDISEAWKASQEKPCDI